MSVRTSNSDVQAIINTALSDTDIQFIIEQANRMVTDTLSGEGLSAARLKDIEMWLAAHLIATTKERQPLEEWVGEVRVTFAQQPKGFMNQTMYGQMVLNLDTTGNFQGNELKKSRFFTIKQTYDGGNEQ